MVFPDVLNLKIFEGLKFFPFVWIAGYRRKNFGVDTYNSLEVNLVGCSRQNRAQGTDLEPFQIFNRYK